MDPSLKLLCCLAALAVVTKINGQKSNDSTFGIPHVSLVRQLSVYPVVADLPNRLLQLYVNWTVPGPEDGPLPVGYHLRVKSVNESDEYCELMDYWEPISDVKTSSAQVPTQVTTVNGDPRVLPECTYKVRVESRPYDGQGAAEVTYTVPERVGNLWSCRNESLMPTPTHLRVSVLNSSAVDVTWSLDAAGDRIATSFSIMLARRLGGPIDLYEYELKLEEPRRWPGHRQAARVAHELSPPEWFKAEVRVVDHRGCHGPAAEAKFRAVDPSGWSRIELLLLVVVPVVAVTLAALLGLIVLCHRRGWLWTAGDRDHRARRGVYKAVGSVVRHPAADPWQAGRPAAPDAYVAAKGDAIGN